MLLFHCHHFDPANVKLGAAFVMSTRVFTAEVVGNTRRWQSLVGDHAIMNRVAHIDELVVSH